MRSEMEALVEGVGLHRLPQCRCCCGVACSSSQGGSWLLSDTAIATWFVC